MSKLKACRNSKLTSDGFSRFPHKMGPAKYDWEAWYYEEPKGFSVCVRELPNGPTVMFDVPRRAIMTWLRHDEARRVGKKEK